MQIEIPEPLLKRLQRHATPFVDTPVNVIEKWADFYELHSQQKAGLETNSETVKLAPAAVVIPPGARLFDSQRPPSLFHTRVRGEFAIRSFSNWNDLLRIAHIHAFEKVKSFEELRRMTRAQIRKGAYSDEGYKHVTEIDISIQGVDADHAWEYAMRLATQLKVTVKAELEWRHNEKAAHPGERGFMFWTP